MEHNKSEPKIVLFDLETMPNLQEVMKVMTQLSNYPGLTMKATINSIICFGYKIFGEKKTNCINAWDFKEWKKDINNDKPLVEKAIEVLSDADCVVTHNGKSFDWKFLQTRIMYHGLNPLPKILHVDTKHVAKSNLFLFNNKLNTLGKALVSEEKLENGGWDLWCKVMQKDPSAMRLMTDYCKQDVNLLEKVFKVLRPLITHLPNYNMFREHDKDCCPNCGSTLLEKFGVRVQKNGVWQRYNCRSCGSRSQRKKESQELKGF